MPAFYAHYRFGCDVLKQLPEDIRSICTAHRGLFDIGLHGPDIYFFYRPVLPNKVNRIGYAAHKRSGRYFLQRAQKVIASSSMLFSVPSMRLLSRKRAAPRVSPISVPGTTMAVMAS